MCLSWPSCLFTEITAVLRLATMLEMHSCLSRSWPPTLLMDWKIWVIGYHRPVSMVQNVIIAHHWNHQAVKLTGHGEMGCQWAHMVFNGGPIQLVPPCSRITWVVRMKTKIPGSMVVPSDYYPHWPPLHVHVCILCAFGVCSLHIYTFKYMYIPSAIHLPSGYLT